MFGVEWSIFSYNNNAIMDGASVIPSSVQQVCFVCVCVCFQCTYPQVSEFVHQITTFYDSNVSRVCLFIILRIIQYNQMFTRLTSWGSTKTCAILVSNSGAHRRRRYGRRYGASLWCVVIGRRYGLWAYVLLLFCRKKNNFFLLWTVQNQTFYSSTRGVHDTPI